MKTKKQTKAQVKSAKIAAKKAAAENSVDIPKEYKESSENEKKRKPSLIPKKKPEVCTSMIEQGGKGKKSSKQTKRDDTDKNIAKKANRATRETSTKTDAVKTSVEKSYEETQIHDVQRYLETLPSPAIRNFIEGLILKDKFNMLTVDIVSAVGDLDRMRYYFQKDSNTGKSRYDPNGRCLDGGTPLHAAIKAKQKDTIQLLIENGADLSLVDFMGDNAIMAAIKAGVANMINLLWPYKANLDVNHQNTVGKTALHLATERSWEGCARFLLSNQAIPDIMDKAGITPLMIAAEKGDMKIVDILIKAGADICLEDEDYDTSVSKALFGNHNQIVDFMLTSLDAARREFFVKDMMCKVMNPPLPDGEYAMPETQYIPILEECTKHGVFRDSFYNQRVVELMMKKMMTRSKQPETVTQICCLVMAVFFRFGREIDRPFVRQFLQSKGTDLIIAMVQVCITEWSFTVKETLQIFLPMIGLVEIPEGRAWLYKNVLNVSEFFNHFEKNFLNNYFGKGDYYLWCSETHYFKEINRVWIHFYNEVSRMQTEQREKHMMALLKEEEREKIMKERKIEKIKQRKEDRIKKIESNTTSEFLKSWTDSSFEEDDEEEADDDDDDETVNTCWNSNAIIGMSNDQNDANQGAGNVVYNPEYSSKHDNGNSQWTKPNGEIIFDQLKKVNDENWTTVQTKKNKEKDKPINDRQKAVRYSPLQSLKSRNCPAQKQRKKKEAKTKPVPLNIFAKPAVASSPGTVRWADVAKGATRDTPHIETNDKRFPKPTNDFCIRETTVFVNRKKERNEAEFPSLNTGLNQTNTKEKPNKMTFHFHSDQPVSSEFDTQVNESDDEAVDIEEAEKELQKFEERTNKEIDTELSVRMSHTGECFMNDPEYTDDTKPNLFDPTNLTDEEINTLNTRGRTQGKDSRSPVSDFYQLEIDNTNSSVDFKIDKSKEIIKSGQIFGKATHFSDDEFEVDDEDLFVDNDNMQCANSSSFEGNHHTGNLIFVKEARQVIENEMTDIDLHLKKRSTKGNSTPNSRAKRKTVVIASEPDGSVRILDDFEYPSMFETLLNKEHLSEEERVIIENQEEQYLAFERQLEMRESEHFMELVISVSPVPEPKTNIIDDLFNTPGEIPEWLEDEEEVPKEEEVWDHMTDSANHFQLANTTGYKETEETVSATFENSEISDTLNINTMPKHKSPYDLLSSDPAIIRCIKQPVEEVGDNISNAIRNEFETTDSLRGRDSLIEPLIEKCKGYSTEYKDQTKSDMEGNEELIDYMENQLNAEKQTAVIKPLGLLPGSNPPATNCAFGQTLLENACRLDEANESDESILYPDDLDGEVYEADDEQSSRHEIENEAFCFPSFHEETMLSAHHNKEDVSITHHMQQLQLEQINNYYMQRKDHITDSASLDQSKFMYYAQSAGINRNEIEQYLQGNVEVEKRNPNRERKTHQVLPQKPALKSDRNCDHIQQDFAQNNPRQDYQTNIQSNAEYQGNSSQLTDSGHSPVLLQHGQHMVHTPNNNVAPRVATQQQVPIMPFVPYGVLVPFSRPPMHPAAIKNIQTQQAAMSSSVRGKIHEILQSMFKSKVKSVRWKNELSSIRGLPSEKLKVIGKIMIPKDESDIICIGRHCTGVTVLGYLSDGSEIAVKIMDSRFRPLKSDEINKLLSIDSSQLFINRYRAIEEYAGCYYIAMDLYEYTLPEYLKIISQNKDIDEKIAVEKLVFQLLRSMLTLHQQYLIVHGELRPENIVIDTDGNLNVSGYGLGRNNAIRQIPRYIEYNDDDKCWLAPEVMLYRQKLIFKTDIWVIGMLIYYIYKGGRNPFGSQPSEIIQNIIRRNYMMEYISEEASNLLGMMLSVNKIERPAVADVLKHPMFWAEEKKIRFISIVGSDVVREMKQNFFLDKKQRENTMTSIVSMTPCNISLLRWMQSIEQVVMKDMKAYRQYKNTLVDLVVFVYNCNNHFEKLAQTTQEIVKEPGCYFLKKFPTLFMTVYRAVKFSNRKDKTCYKPFF